MIDSITGIILAGGKSARLGTNKAFLNLGRKTVIGQVLTNLEDIFKEIIIITNEIEQFNFLKTKIISDIIPYKGPLGGIYTGLIKSNSFYNLFVACDMPFLNQDLIRYLLEKRNGYDVVVPKYNDRLQPLCTVYSKNCITPIEIECSRNNLKIIDFFQYVKVRVINEKEVRKFDAEGICFININTPQDYQKVKDNLAL